MFNAFRFSRLMRRSSAKVDLNKFSSFVDAAGLGQFPRKFVRKFQDNRAEAGNRRE